jgi:hypothetical protein
MLPSWDETMDQLKSLGNAILENDQSPDHDVKKNLDRVFKIIGNIVFLIIALLFIAGLVLWLYYKYYYIIGQVGERIPIHVKIGLLLSIAFGLILFLSMLAKPDSVFNPLQVGRRVHDKSDELKKLEPMFITMLKQIEKLLK